MNLSADTIHARDGPHSDALVIFGFTGDLASKKIIPALYAMAKKGTLTVPVVGVASSKWSIDQLHQRVRDSIELESGIDDQPAFDRLTSMLHYVSGNYQDPATFKAIKTTLNNVQRPAHYLAIPPWLFATVIKSLGAAGLSEQGRVIIENPFGRRADLILVDTTGPHHLGVDHPVPALALHGRAADVTTVIVDGRIVIDQRQLVGIDEHEMADVARRALAIVARHA